MKAYKIIKLLIFLFLIKFSFANNFFQQENIDDTIKIKTSNNIEVNIIAIDSSLILNNINEIIFQTGDSLNKIKEKSNKLTNNNSVSFYYREDSSKTNNNFIKNRGNTNFLGNLWENILLKNLDYNIYNKNGIIRYSIFLDLGLINYLEDWQIPIIKRSQQYSLSQLGSFNINLGGNVRLRFSRVFSMNIEAAFGWNFYSFKDRSTILSFENNMINFKPRIVTNTEEYSFSKSRLITPSLDIAVLPIFHVIRLQDIRNAPIINIFNMRFAVGVFGGYRFVSTIKYRYSIGQVEQRYSQKGNYYLNRFHYGVKAMIGFGNYFDIYFKYYINTLYEKDKANPLNLISLGLRISI